MQVLVILVNALFLVKARQGQHIIPKSHLLFQVVTVFNGEPSEVIITTCFLHQQRGSLMTTS